MREKALDLSQHYLLKAALRLVPHGIGSAVDVLLSEAARRSQERRARVFFDELAAGEVQLTDELIENEDFLHCLFASLRAATRARRDEKVALFARALTNGIVREQAGTVDEFDEAISILEDLSFREWQSLLLFETHLAEAEGETEVKKVMAIWAPFCDEASERLAIPREEVADFMSRIARSGLFRPLHAFWDDTGELGTITPGFRRLKVLLGDR